MAKKDTKAAPMLLHVADDPKVAELAAKLAEHAAKLPRVRSELEGAKRQAAEAQARTERAELAVLAGRATDADLAAAQARLADAKRTLALLTHAHEDEERYAALLPQAMEAATLAARAEVVANVRQLAGERALELKRALLAAREAQRAYFEVHAIAAQEVQALPHRGRVSLWFCADLGEAGAATQAAGVPDLVFDGVGGVPGAHADRLTAFLQQIDGFLADLPEMAERDKGRLAQHLASDELAAKHSAELDRTLARLDRDSDLLGKLLG
jgi:hypothetical protein